MSHGRPPLDLPIVCLISDRTLVDLAALPGVIAAAVGAGVTMVQVREKEMPTRELMELVSHVIAAAGPSAPVIVNGRADVAFAAGAAGVHLPSDGLPVAGARAALGRGGLLGRSVHTLDEVEREGAEDLDYLELGAVFPSRSHPGGVAIGLDAVRAASIRGKPILAVGGITAANAAEVIAAGASGVAVISAILAAHDPGEAAARLSAIVRTAWMARDAATSAAR